MEQLKQKVAKNLRKVLDGGTSANSLANRSNQTGNGVSVATLTNLANGKSDSISDKMLYRIADLINMKLTDEVHWEFRGDNIHKIGGVLKVAANESEFFWIDGESGQGKSYALTYWRDKGLYDSNEMQVAYLELLNGMSNKHICHALLSLKYSQRKINNLPKSPSKLREEVAKMLIDHYKVLVLDQMEYGIDRAGTVKFIHGLYDLIKGKVGIVFCGAHTLTTIYKKGILQKKPYYNQFANRFEAGFRLLDSIDPAYIEKACQHEGITDTTAINWFKYHCKHMRVFVPRIKKALAYVRANGKKTSEITEKLLNQLNKTALKTKEALEL